MAYLSTITLKVGEINAPKKKRIKWIRNKIQIYAA